MRFPVTFNPQQQIFNCFLHGLLHPENFWALGWIFSQPQTNKEWIKGRLTCEGRWMSRTFSVRWYVMINIWSCLVEKAPMLVIHPPALFLVALKGKADVILAFLFLSTNPRKRPIQQWINPTCKYCLFSHSPTCLCSGSNTFSLKSKHFEPRGLNKGW